MKRKIRSALSGLLISLFFLLSTSSHYARASSSDIYHPYGYFIHPYPNIVLKPGDIIVGHYPGQEYTVVGYWSHAGILYKYDPTIGDWLVVEALYEGVTINTLREFMSRYSAVIILRVYGVSDTQAANAARWAYSKLGYPYDYNGYYKQVYGPSYYCSELVWAAYMATTGVDIDAYYWLPQNWYGVLPGEIVADSDTYAVWYSNLEG
ncbi:MAG: YiiX/YebB-like N1pC/P60 family cysteine hydrolase [Infirmifilum uzonense]|uniref:YiiX/YebB-like N1pC/P60 family cysteine hydrolase n=1 Tax=Infirmifilum uzonense TaxID=1550241 RepID=UPI003C782271